MSTDDRYELACPMPECGEVLLLSWEYSYTLGPADLAEAPALGPDAAHVSTWQVSCVAGHVILVPGDPHCPCPDPGGDACMALGPEHELAYDWSEESRTFRPHDWARLVQVFERLVDHPPAVREGTA